MHARRDSVAAERFVDDLPPQRLARADDARADEHGGGDPSLGEAAGHREGAGMPVVEGHPQRASWQRMSSGCRVHQVGSHGAVGASNLRQLAPERRPVRHTVKAQDAEPGITRLNPQEIGRDPRLTLVDA